MRIANKVGASIALALANFLSLPEQAMAGPSDYVHSPIVEEGERELDFKLGSARLRDGGRESAVSLGLGFGMNAWWSTEVYAKANRETPQGWRFDARAGAGIVADSDPAAEDAETEAKIGAIARAFGKAP